MSEEEKKYSSFSSSLTTASSVTNTEDSSKDWKLDNKCYICQKKFNLTTRRHHCRFCGGSVCNEHSLKRRAKQGESEKHRICDNCDIEIIKSQINQEIQQELQKLRSEIQTTKETNRNLYEEHFQKSKQVHELENQLVTAEHSQAQQEQEFAEALEKEQKKAEESRKHLEEIRNALESTNQSEREYSEKCALAEEELENLRDQSDSLRERKEELASQIEHLTSKQKSSLPLDQVREILCNRCTQRLNQTCNPFASAGTIIEEENEESVISNMPDLN